MESDGRANASGARRKELWAALALCAVALLAYSNSFHTGFAFDNSWILKEERIHEVTRQNIDSILQHTYWWPGFETGLYRPVTTFSYLFNYAVLGNRDRPEAYHWVNFILHAGNIVLAFALALRLVRRFWPSVFIAGLWAVHPVLTESVTNIVGRADLLSGAAVLGGFLIFLQSTESRGWRRLAWLGGLLLVTAIGVFSKESAVTVIGVIALYELTWWNERGNMRDLVGGTIAVLLPILALLYRRSVVLAASSPAVFPFLDNPLTGAGFWRGRLTAVKVLARYLGLILWPARLSHDYSWSEIPLISGKPADWAACLAVCAIGMALVLLYRRRPAMFFFGLFAFGVFLPTSNLLFPIGTIMAERLLYLPAYGLIACLVLSIFWIAERTGLRALAPAVLLLAMFGFSVRTWARNPDWRNDLTLAQSAVRASPRSFKAHAMLASELYIADRQNLDRSIAEGERAITLIDALPDSRNIWWAYRWLAGYYSLKGDRPASQRAVQLLTRATGMFEAQPRTPAPGATVMTRTDAADCYRALATARLRVADSPGAYEAAVRARDLDPASSAAYRAMGYALHALDRDDDAITAFLEGQFLTGDSSLLADAVLVLRTRPDSDCTISQGAYGPEPNARCPIVRKEICAAAAEVMRVQLRLARREQAARMMNQAVEKFGCDVDPLRKILADPQ